jgi:thermitase
VSTGQGVRIGIVDTGVDLGHQDLAGKVVDNASCVNSGGDPSKCSGSAQDDNGHGTHVSGIAAADTNNGVGVAGAAPQAQLVVAKVLDSNGSGSFSDVNGGIKWVVDHGAKVVNLSLGDATPIVPGVLGQNSIADGITYTWNHGAVPVLAAGNTNYFGLGSQNYGDSNAIVVGATGADGHVASYSSPPGTAKWAVVAPGGDGSDSTGQPSCDGAARPRCVVSTYWAAGQATSYAFDEGTSMATPHVAGTVALLLAKGDNQTQAVSDILSSANKSIAGECHCAGRLDASSAVGAGPTVAAPSPPRPAASGPAVRQGTAPRPGSAGAAKAAPPTASSASTLGSQPQGSGVAAGSVSPTDRGGGATNTAPGLAVLAFLVAGFTLALGIRRSLTT